MAKLDKLVLGQREHDMSEDFSLMAEEAINTSGVMLYSLMNAALKVFALASTGEEQEEWDGHAVTVTYWAGFLEGVRTQKQKQREKRQKKSRLATRTLNGGH